MTAMQPEDKGPRRKPARRDRRGRPRRARVPVYRGYTGPNGRGTARACIGHPRPGPEPDLILYPVIDLLARLMLGDDWRTAE